MNVIKYYPFYHVIVHEKILRPTGCQIRREKEISIFTTEHHDILSVCTCERDPKSVIVGLECEPDDLSSQPLPVQLILHVLLLWGAIFSLDPSRHLHAPRSYFEKNWIFLKISSKKYSLLEWGYFSSSAGPNFNRTFSKVSNILLKSKKNCQS